MRSTKLVLVLVTFSLATCAVTAQDKDEEEVPYLPGLIATYSDRSEHSFQRLDEAIAFHWGEGSPDSRVAATDFTVHWRGKLFAQGEGAYHLAVHASGEVEIKLAGKMVISRQEANGWVFSEPITLEFDRHKLEVRFRKTKNPAHISLFWSGPQFQLEPVPPRHLMHDRKESITPLYERGELLAAALRCAACHREEMDSRPLPAPSLVNLGGNLSADWLGQWLGDKGQEEFSIRRRMPAYGFSAGEAEAITAYLFANQPAQGRPEKPAKAALPQTKKKVSGKPPASKPPDPPAAAAGERLALTLGCLACHQVNGLGESGLFGGGDLSTIAAKRPAGFFSAWLAEPAKLNPDHRMPVFDLGLDERASLSLYLASLGPFKKPVREDKPDASLVAVGRKLVATHRCANCHSLPKDPELAAAATATRLSDKSDWHKSCAAGLEPGKAHVGYSLTKDDQKALQEYFSARRAIKSGESRTSGRLALVQNNCLACHGREGTESISLSLPKKLADKLATLAEKHPDLAASVPAMTPPSLNSIGDKLHEEALATAIRRQGPPHRDYLLVRMPRFPLPDDELKRLVNYFVQTDRIPPLPDAAAPKPSPAEEAAFSLAGSRLVSTDGFGCTSCHQVGKVIPDKAPLNARGPSLSAIDKRIRKEWYDRFLHNPARIVPRMEMPSVQIPVRGVLDSKLDRQLAALWHVLATPGFEPPEPNAVRVLRLSGDLEKRESPVVVTDLVKMGDKTFVRPFLVGLPNRHNVLFDLETNRLVAWWIGDAARQRTKGKSWYWEAAGISLIEFPHDSQFLVELEGKEYPLERRPQGFCEPSSWHVQPGSAFLNYEGEFISFGKPEGDHRFRLMDTLAPIVDEEARTSGFRRNFVLLDVPHESPVRLRLVSIESFKTCVIAEDGKLMKLAGKGNPRIRLEESKGIRFEKDGRVVLKGPGTSRTVQLSYLVDLVPDEFQSDAKLGPEISDVNPLEIGPGLRAARLSLPRDILPTGLSWSEDERLLFCTLRGEVYLASNQGPNSEVLAWKKIIDGLPAPYGLQPNPRDNPPSDEAERTVEVATKLGVIQLHYFVNKPRTIATVVSSGWGYTSDYHDWSVGVIPAHGGGSFIGLPCQQDERNEAASNLRGTVIKIPPDEVRRRKGKATHEVLSTGHRFPMGLAVNRDGDLFVTDNQGNYNPFNELNHVRKGAFFGFVNANDKKNKDYKVPPTTEPAINIPHPWTRSVNGICFLYTPRKLREETGKDAFGPLEGQLVGCEYDTRRLIRMSLQKIGDTYQGCAYPLSREPSSPEKGFLGPIVCAVSPRGELYVGSIRESGWGAGNNVGEIVKIKFEPERMPCGIAEVKAVKGGFSIDFLREVDAKKAADIASFSISSYRRISTPAYGGPDVDRRIEKVDSVELSADRRRVTVQLPELRTGGFVYEFQLKDLAPADTEFFPAEAFFTLHGVP